MNRTLSHHEEHLVALLEDGNLLATILHICFIWGNGGEKAIATSGEDCNIYSVSLSSETQ